MFCTKSCNICAKIFLRFSKTAQNFDIISHLCGKSYFAQILKKILVFAHFNVSFFFVISTYFIISCYFVKFWETISRNEWFNHSGFLAHKGTEFLPHTQIVLSLNLCNIIVQSFDFSNLDNLISHNSYQRSTTSSCKNMGVRKSEFVAKRQFGSAEEVKSSKQTKNMINI